jgi:hypothetical protein
MSIKLNSVLIFAAGAAIGSVVTWKVVKDKYENIMQEVLDSVRGEDYEEYEEDDEIIGAPNALEEMRTVYNNISQASGYQEGYVEDKEGIDVPEAYIISPEEFDTIGYNTESLNHYADGVLTDQEDNIIDYPEELIGNIDPAEHYGEYEQDSVFIRNDAKQCDYEILRDTSNFRDVVPTGE